MKFFHLSVISILALSACTPGGDTPQDKSSGISATVIPCDTWDKTDAEGAWIDPGMSYESCSDIKTVYHGLHKANLSTTPGSNFERIFGGTSSTAAASYLNQRVHYIVPSEVPLNIQIQDQNISYRLDDYALASNLGIGLWIAKTRMANRSNLSTDAVDVKLLLGASGLEIKTPSSGIILLGPKFPRFSLIEKMETMIHEARHTDCESETSKQCGYPHIKCPQGHDYEGIHACDETTAGPYFIGAVYSKAIAETCENCSEQERMIARLMTLDSIGRVMNLEDTSHAEIAQLHSTAMAGHEKQRTILSDLHAQRTQELAQESTQEPKGQ